MTTIGKYDVLMPLSPPGQTQSQTYLAAQKGFGGFRKLVVIREVLQDIQGDDAAQKAFLKEVRAVASFHHPNIADVYDLEASEGRLVVATEFVPGATLAEISGAFRSSKLRVPLGLMLMAFRDAAHALHYAHHFTDPVGNPEPVAHGALTAARIQITFDGMTKVLGFGAPKPIDSARTPEADLKALGALLPQALALTAEDTSLAGRNDLTPELRAVMARLATDDPTQRFPVALDFVKSLETAAGAVIWRPEQSAALIQRMFTERRDEQRNLLSGLADPGSSTAVMPLSKVFSQGHAPEDPDTLPPVDQQTQPRIPAPFPPGVGGLQDGPTLIRRSGERPGAAPPPDDGPEETPDGAPDEGPRDISTDVRQLSQPSRSGARRRRTGGGSRALRWLFLLVLAGIGLLIGKWRVDPDWVRVRSPKLAHELEKLAVIKGFPGPPPALPALDAASDGGGAVEESADAGARAAAAGPASDGGARDAGARGADTGPGAHKATPPPPPPPPHHHHGK